MTAEPACRLVTSLTDAMAVRRLRNSCAQFMTNAREPISRWAQTKWYLKHYRRALREQRYRVFLFLERSRPVGYGALQLDQDQLLITECVDTEHRARGLGTTILNEMIAIAQREGRDLIAEIWASNGPSIGLHEKAGFVLEETRDHPDGELRVYRLAPGR